MTEPPKPPDELLTLFREAAEEMHGAILAFFDGTVSEDIVLAAVEGYEDARDSLCEGERTD